MNEASINSSEFREAFDRTGATAAAATTAADGGAATAPCGSDSSTSSGSGTATNVAEKIIVGGEEVEETDVPKRKMRLIRRKKKKMVDETNEIDVPFSESERGGYDNTRMMTTISILTTVIIYYCAPSGWNDCNCPVHQLLNNEMTITSIIIPCKGTNGYNHWKVGLTT